MVWVLVGVTGCVRGPRPRDNQVRGLEFKFGRGLGPRDRSEMGWSCLCLGYKRDVCFGVSSWDTLVRESPFS